MANMPHMVGVLLLLLEKKYLMMMRNNDNQFARFVLLSFQVAIILSIRSTIHMIFFVIPFCCRLFTPRLAK